MTTSNLPSHGVYIVEAIGDKVFSAKIGAAWPNRDGEGLTVQLLALPVTGQLIIQELKAKRDDE